MIITISQKWGNHRKYIDIQIKESQKIMDTLEVLFQSGLLLGEDVKNMTHVYSERNRQFINTQLTYEQAMILNGDILSYEGGEKESE